MKNKIIYPIILGLSVCSIGGAVLLSNNNTILKGEGTLPTNTLSFSIEKNFLSSSVSTEKATISPRTPTYDHMTGFEYLGFYTDSTNSKWLSTASTSGSTDHYFMNVEATPFGGGLVSFTVGDSLVGSFVILYGSDTFGEYTLSSSIDSSHLTGTLSGSYFKIMNSTNVASMSSFSFTYNCHA